MEDLLGQFGRDFGELGIGPQVQESEALQSGYQGRHLLSQGF